MNNQGLDHHDNDNYANDSAQRWDNDNRQSVVNFLHWKQGESGWHCEGENQGWRDDVNKEWDTSNKTLSIFNWLKVQVRDSKLGFFFVPDILYVSVCVTYFGPPQKEWR